MDRNEWCNSQLVLASKRKLTLWKLNENLNDSLSPLLCQKVTHMMLLNIYYKSVLMIKVKLS